MAGGASATEVEIGKIVVLEDGVPREQGVGGSLKAIPQIDVRPAIEEILAEYKLPIDANKEPYRRVEHKYLEEVIMYALGLEQKLKQLTAKKGGEAKDKETK